MSQIIVPPPPSLPDNLAGSLLAMIIFLLPWLIAAIVLAAIIILGLWMVSKRTYHRWQTAFAQVILLVVVPKDSAKEKERQETQEAVREDISVAETLFSALGGMRAERGLKALFFGRQDHFSFEIVA